MYLTYTFDAMGRVATMKNGYNASDGSVTNWVQGISYDPADHVTSQQYLTTFTDDQNGDVSRTFTTEAKTFNANGQMTSMSWSGSSPSLNGGLTYTYSSTQNNGQITQTTDTLSGETIVYQYDLLKRLTSASSTPNSGSTPTAWTETFQFDGFGNLTAKVLNGTTTPIAVNAATNQLSSAYYDANGNMTSGAGATLTYDGSNRLTSAAETGGGIEYYFYGADNKRVYRRETNGAEEYTFWGAHGERLGVWTVPSSGLGGNSWKANVYFGGKMITENAAFSQSYGMTPPAPVFLDRVGTDRLNGARFYPFGDEITSTSNDRHEVRDLSAEFVYGAGLCGPEVLRVRPMEGSIRSIRVRPARSRRVR